MKAQSYATLEGGSEGGSIEVQPQQVNEVVVKTIPDHYVAPGIKVIFYCLYTCTESLYAALSGPPPPGTILPSARSLP